MQDNINKRTEPPLNDMGTLRGEWNGKNHDDDEEYLEDGIDDFIIKPKKKKYNDDGDD